MDANVVAPVAEPVATAEPTAEDQALAIIANTGKASVSATSVTPEPQPVAEPTPTPTPTDPPTGQVPVTPNTGTPAEGGAQTPTDPTPVATSDGAIPVVDEAKAFDEALGLPPETVETTDVWREKASAATQEIGRIEAERQAQTESLSEQGYELVHVGDGKYQLATTDEYKSKFDIDGDIDLSKLIEPLSEAQRDAMLTDAEGTFAKLAKGVAKKVGLELLAKRPAIKASAQKALLTEHDTSDCYNSFVTSKRPDGTTPLYPDADKPEVQGYMTRIWNAGSPAMDAVRDAAMRDKGLYMAATELCYYKAAYGMAQTKERIRLAGEQANADSLKNQNEPIVSAGSSGAPPAAASTGTPATAEDQALSVIGAAKPA